MAVEIELKLEIDDPACLALVEQLTLVEARQFEDNHLFDKGDCLKSRECVLRLRQYGSKWKLTFKGPAEIKPNGIKSRTEHECSVGDGVATRAILEALGYVATFRYQKYRTTYRSGPVDIMVDETPMGWFVEFEGPEDEIAPLVSRLGLSDLRVISETYVHLYLARRQNNQPDHMVFSE